MYLAHEDQRTVSGDARRRPQWARRFWAVARSFQGGGPQGLTRRQFLRKTDISQSETDISQSDKAIISHAHYPAIPYCAQYCMEIFGTLTR